MGSASVAPDTVLRGKYRIERVLGRGGMGVVVAARHISLDELVAIKILSSEATNTVELAQRFTREARAAAKLKSDHVVRVTDVDELDDGTPFMVMEMLDGVDLGQYAAEQGPLAPAVAIGLVLQACEVLDEAHALGIVHRDIKPANLFVTRDDAGQPFIKVLDFGIAKAPEAMGVAITSTQSLLGTPAYMSPEQLRASREVDPRSDIWAIGCVLYELIEGHRTFGAQTLTELIIQVAVEPTPALARTPPGLAAILERCLAKEPDERFGNVGELATALRSFLALGSSATLATAVPAVTPAPRRRRGAWLAVAGVTVALAAGAAIVVATRGHDDATATPPAAVVRTAPVPSAPPAIHQAPVAIDAGTPVVTATVPPVTPAEPPPVGDAPPVKATAHAHAASTTKPAHAAATKTPPVAPPTTPVATPPSAGSAACDPYSRLGC